MKSRASGNWSPSWVAARTPPTGRERRARRSSASRRPRRSRSEHEEGERKAERAHVSQEACKVHASCGSHERPTHRSSCASVAAATPMSCECRTGEHEPPSRRPDRRTGRREDRSAGDLAAPFLRPRADFASHPPTGAAMPPAPANDTIPSFSPIKASARRWLLSIRDALRQANGNRGHAAAALGISRVTPWRRMRELRLLGAR